MVSSIDFLVIDIFMKKVIDIAIPYPGALHRQASGLLVLYLAYFLALKTVIKHVDL